MESAARKPERTARSGFLGTAEWTARTLARGMAPGLVAGVIVGGLGSRLAMRVLATTSPLARGFETDFGATVGEITAGGTLFLLILGGLLGMIGGILYLAIRGVLPRNAWLAGVAFGVVLLALSGRLLVDPNNLDFVILSPLPVAVALFSALPLVFGLVFVPLARWMEPAILGTRLVGLLIPLVLVGLAPLALAGGFGLLALGVTLLVAWARPSVGPGTRTAVRLVGSALLAAVVVWRGALFVAGLIELV